MADDMLIEHEDAVLFAEKETVTFMDLGNCVIETIKRSGRKVTYFAYFDPLYFTPLLYPSTLTYPHIIIP